MSYATWIADACRRQGLQVVETPDWKTRGKEEFAPRGVVCHHTAGPPTGTLPSLRTLIGGRSDLPGPLCHVGLGRDGTVVVVAAGRANHAGTGSWNKVSGNRSMLGIEAENSGHQAWPDAQLRAYEKVCAAFMLGAGFGADMICSHHEWAGPRKADPHDLDMDAFRARVAALRPGDGRPPPPITIPQGDDVPGYLIRHTSGAIYLTDGITRRHVQSPSEFEMLAFLGQAKNSRLANGDFDIPTNDQYLAAIPEVT